MATAKKRIYISVTQEMEDVLNAAAKEDNVPAATKASELLKLSLEEYEDELWAKIAERRDDEDATCLTHEEVWG